MANPFFVFVQNVIQGTSRSLWTPGKTRFASRSQGSGEAGSDPFKAVFDRMNAVPDPKAATKSRKTGASMPEKTIIPGSPAAASEPVAFTKDGLTSRLHAFEEESKEENLTLSGPKQKKNQILVQEDGRELLLVCPSAKTSKVGSAPKNSSFETAEAGSVSWNPSAGRKESPVFPDAEKRVEIFSEGPSAQAGFQNQDIQTAASKVLTGPPILDPIPGIRPTSVQPDTKTTENTDQSSVDIRPKSIVHTIRKGLVHQVEALPAEKVPDASEPASEESTSSRIRNPRMVSRFAVHPIVRDFGVAESQTIKVFGVGSNPLQDATRIVQKGLVHPHVEPAVTEILEGTTVAESSEPREPIMEGWTGFPLRHGQDDRVIQKGIVRPVEKDLFLDSKFVGSGNEALPSKVVSGPSPGSWRAGIPISAEPLSNVPMAGELRFIMVSDSIPIQEFQESGGDLISPVENGHQGSQPSDTNARQTLRPSRATGQNEHPRFVDIDQRMESVRVGKEARFSEAQTSVRGSGEGGMLRTGFTPNSGIPAGDPGSFTNPASALRTVAASSEEIPLSQDRPVIQPFVPVVMRMVQTGESRMVVSLTPKEFGDVRIEIITEKDMVRAQFTVDSEEAKTAVEESLPELKAELEKQGFGVEDLIVEIHEEGNERSGRNRFEDADSRAHGRPHMSDAGEDGQSDSSHADHPRYFGYNTMDIVA